MEQNGRRNVEIFNFSFLDILACTIGLLIFIMVMVFVLQTGTSVLVDQSKVISRMSDRAQVLQKQKESDEAISVRLEAEISKMGALVDRSLLDRRLTAKIARDEEQKQFASKSQMLEKMEAELLSGVTQTQNALHLLPVRERDLGLAQTELSVLERTLSSAKAQVNTDHILVRKLKLDDAWADADVLHVECRKDRVTAIQIDADGKSRVLGETQEDDLSRRSSDFLKRLNEYKEKPNSVVVFWVRPDGVKLFQKAKEQLPEGMNYGYEPALANWVFGSQP